MILPSRRQRYINNDRFLTERKRNVIGTRPIGISGTSVSGNTLLLGSSVNRGNSLLPQGLP
jgi:hypothetical protein